MRLADWLAHYRVKRTDFARRIGVSPGAVTQICREERAWISRETAERIVAETKGAVTPNDFLPNLHQPNKAHEMSNPVTQAIEVFARGEIVIVTEGHGTARVGTETLALAPGIVVRLPLGEKLALANGSDVDVMRYLIIKVSVP